SGIYARDIWDIVHRRILHCDSLLRSVRRRAERFFQSLLQFLPAPKNKFPAGKRIEFELLDRLHNFHRLTRRRDIVEPTTRGEHFFVQLQNPISERIAVPEIVKEPAIEFGLAQSASNFSHAFCWRLFCTHWSNKREAKNNSCEDTNASHENGGNFTAISFLCTTRLAKRLAAARRKVRACEPLDITRRVERQRRAG